MSEPNIGRGVDYRSDYASNDYLDEEFRRDIQALWFLSVRFNDISLTRRILRCVMERIVKSEQIGWIDPDYGWVISAHDFFRRTDAEPDWDWRTSPEE